MGSSFKHFRFVLRIKSSHHICSDDIWLFPRSLENLQWCWFTTTQWGHLKSTAQSCQQTNKQTNNAETSTICQWKTQGGKRAATATCSDTSLTWWQTRFRWVAPRELGPWTELFPPSHHLFGHHCLVQLPAGRSCRLPESRWRWQFAFWFFLIDWSGTATNIGYKINIKLIIRLRYSGSS